MFPPRPAWNRRGTPPSARAPTLQHDLGAELRNARMALGLYAGEVEARLGFAPWLDLEDGLASVEEIRAARAALDFLVAERETATADLVAELEAA